MFDKEKDLVNQGYLALKESGNLILFNYTDKCTYDKKWNKITKKMRGNVYDKNTGRLIALAFPKFFNIEELPVSKSRNLIKKTDYKCYDKVDGSLGIIYNHKRKWRMNTRGSFNSEQSIKGLEILNKNYDISNLPFEYTILVEIIYPDNRIIIDYGDDEKLVLLSCFERTSGRELERKELEEVSKITKIPLVKEYNLTFDEMFEFQQEDQLDSEGFVVRFVDGYRVKIKSKKYLKIARILSKMTYLNIWRNMENGKVNTDFKELIPEEFREELELMIEEMEHKYIDLKKLILSSHDKTISRIENDTGIQRDDPCFKKELGLRSNDILHVTAMFLILNDKLDKLDFYIMKRIKPKGNIIKLNGEN